jgi:peptidoglycan/LPS O-acetylase OafA/YrhL
MQYFQKIDGLRFIAISVVFVHHIASIFSTYIDWGYFGVDLFFVISGFLITLILLKSKGKFKKVYGNFLARRCLRIFPLYYFALAILIIIGHPVVRENIGYLLSYTFNYKFPFITEDNPVGHFWSLCVEEQYYLFWPFIVLGLRKQLNSLSLVVIIMIFFAYLQIHFNIIPSISVYNYTGLTTRMGSLGLGSLGAILFTQQSNLLRLMLDNKYIEYTMYAICISALVFFIPFLMGVSSLFLVLKAAQNSFHFNGVSRLLSNKKVLYMGRISYGLYVYHIIVIFYGTPYVFDPFWNSIDFESFGRLSVLQYHSWLLKLPIYVGLTILISEVSYRYFENPLLRLKNAYFKNE